MACLLCFVCSVHCGVGASWPLRPRGPNGSCVGEFDYSSDKYIEDKNQIQINENASFSKCKQYCTNLDNCDMFSFRRYKMSDEEISSLSKNIKIHIAIDLMAHTGGHGGF